MPLLLFEFTLNRQHAEYRNLALILTCFRSQKFFELSKEPYGTPSVNPKRRNQESVRSQARVGSQADVGHRRRPVVEALEVLQARQAAQSSKQID